MFDEGQNAPLWTQKEVTGFAAVILREWCHRACPASIESGTQTDATLPNLAHHKLVETFCEHADASGLLNHQNPILPALLSIDLEQEARIDDHEARLEDLEAALGVHDDSISDNVPEESKN